MKEHLLLFLTHFDDYLETRRNTGRFKNTFGKGKKATEKLYSENLKLTTTLDRAITQNPCYVPYYFGL